ncbi:hypothetical protein ACFPFP_40835 [Bradyrhizobium sp. GCM10023182]|uniref:O-antigen ligase domain-containing protein n=1 Tax=Bradyrhizobium zhengyangense TaxID=2911009 RepID=A0ABS9M1S5_9BRAD|nr:hypothetical protein [Bradyrhizobium zhengyangense]MCG2673209.1 hypothetical protein [Bradyrhizobium zhengyangense]
MQFETPGNWFAVFAVLGWPLVSIVLYRNFSVVKATVWTVLGALLLLPSGFALKLPMLPALDKNSVSSVCVLIASYVLVRRRLSFGVGLVEILAAFFLLGPVVTSLLNSDTIIRGETILPGVDYYDGISALLSQSVMFIAFLAGRRSLRDTVGTETIVRSLAVAGLLYSLPMLLEVRLSPQLSNWIYGFFPTGFSSEVRYGGFRPVVFMKNGLTAAFFLMTALLAAVAIWRVDGRKGQVPPAGRVAYLGIVLLLCKSVGALIYGLVIGPLVRWASPQAQLRVAVLLVSIALLYPMLRIMDLFPDKLLVETAAEIDTSRAASLKLRFDQEQKLLEHAHDRFTFGWGRYGRNRVYEEAGKDSSITDGAWIQVLGTFGLFGFLSQFGLLALPIFRALSACSSVRSERDRIALAALALIVALNLVEQLPNSSISAWNWMLAGALIGRAESIRGSVGSRAQDRSTIPNRGYGSNPL